MNIKEKYGCAYPFTHTYVVKNKQGYEIRPCCFAEMQTVSYVENIEQIQNHFYLENIRRQFMSGEIPVSCKSCVAQEKFGKSWRERSFNETNPELGYTSWDIRLDNNCNLKCLMCNADNSSKWREDFEILKKYNLAYENKNREIGDIDFLISATANKATQINLLGGEPFYSKKTFEFCNKLKEYSYNRQHTILNFVTNGSHISDAWKKCLQYFSKVCITFSIDGINESQFLIRFPTKWNEFCKTLEYVKSQKWLYNFNTTISALNLPFLTDIEKFSKPLWYINYLSDPAFLSFNSLKYNVIEKIVLPKKVEKYIIDNYKFNEEHNIMLQNYLVELDTKRKTNSKKILSHCFL